MLGLGKPTMKYVTLSGAAWLLLSQVAVATEIKYVSAGRESPLLQAAVQGNETVLDAYAERNPYPMLKAFAAAAAERSRFDFTESDKKAHACYAEAKAAQPPTATFMMACGELRVGNALLAGRFKDWATEAARVRAELYPLFPSTPGVELRDAALEAPEAAMFADWSASSFSRSVTKGRVEAVAPDLASLRGLVSVKSRANGTDLTLLVDTGTQMTVLSRADANRVKSKQNGATVMDLASSPDAKGVTVKSALIDVLELGSFRISHANVGVWDQPFSVLGLDLLRQLPDPVRLDRQGLSFGGGAMAAACGGRLVLRSELGGRPAQIHMSGMLDGVAKDFLIDTGNNGGVSRRAAPGEVAEQSINVMTISGPNQTRSSMRTQSVGLGMPAKAEQVRVLSETAAEEPVIGAGVLGADRSLWLSFAHHRGCVTPSAVAP